MDDNWKDCAVSEKNKKEVVLLITIDPYPVYHLATTCLETDSMYEFFAENDALPVEEKGCGRKSRGTND